MKHPLTCALLFVAACGSAGNSGVSDLAPDFLLEDVNPTSTTSGMDVSPRDYMGNVSAYYFGAAT